ncbi:MAG TPA: regulatory protein RecX [Bacteroidia bacterium]|jgi:regulatory protein|nr:regulatory protein RecX [Bacteroidia bacterium]
MDKRTKKSPSIDDALARVRKYCAYSERSKVEVKKKLVEYGVMEGDINMILEKLVKEGFLNESRFALAFAGGKFRMKKWGRTRIKMEMKRKGLSQELIEQGLSELPEKAYTDTLDELLNKKWKQLQGKSEGNNSKPIMAEKQKLIRYALQKGYEQDIVMNRMSKLGLL